MIVCFGEVSSSQEIPIPTKKDLLHWGYYQRYKNQITIITKNQRTTGTYLGPPGWGVKQLWADLLTYDYIKRYQDEEDSQE